MVNRLVKRLCKTAGGKKGSPDGRFGLAMQRKRAQPMTYGGGVLKSLLGLSGANFPARNQIPGGEERSAKSFGRMEAASPKRRPRDSAIMVMARVHQSSGLNGVESRFIRGEGCRCPSHEEGAFQALEASVAWGSTEEV